MQDKLGQLKASIAEAVDLYHAASVLEWDQETYMPDGGAPARADQLSTLRGLAHRLMTSEQVGTLFQELLPYLDQLDYDSDDASFIRVGWREYQKLARVPTELEMEIARASSLALQAWKEARATNNFSLFEPHLSKMVELQLRRAEALGGAEVANPYDALLDFYDTGMTTTYIDGVFSALKPPLIELVQAIAARPDAVDDSILQGEFDPEVQMAFGRRVAQAIGYDFERGRLDLSAHPFTIHFGRHDVRITTRIDPHNPASALMSTIHEAGHALYEQNTAPSLYRTGLDQGCGMSVHESQSRFYENVLGRCRAFWHYWYPEWQKTFAPHFDSVDLESFYRALNKSQPSLIRVEADEVTYGLHIILRFELENDLINGRVQVKDLPREWNARMEAYLGLVPPTDSQGVLQDIHWAMGLIGYFPDYLLGSILAVQLWEKMQQDIPDVIEQIKRGQYAAINAWLTEHIHRHGRKYTFAELTERVTGGPLRWEPYMAYLRGKYGEIYGL